MAKTFHGCFELEWSDDEAKRLERVLERRQKIGRQGKRPYNHVPRMDYVSVQRREEQRALIALLRELWQ